MKIIYKGGMGEIVEKKSRFIANVFPVMNEEEAGRCIYNMKKQYYDARHNCFAYVCGEDNEIQKFSDDGEPSGTAGKPMLDIITALNIRNCLIVVTRYFGGTLLGTGGLIRAYQAAAKAGIEHSDVAEVYEGIIVSITADYNNVGKLQYICSDAGAEILMSEYGENVHMEVLMEKDKYIQFSQKVTDAFSGIVNVSDTQRRNFCKTKENKTILMKKCE
ncbi:MAG: YigZ family protein [Eubacteriales bacterium]|nr:YigZ family protein [Eubacteriales bacterium]